MIYLEPAHEAIIKSILAPYPYPFFAFGSRVKGTQKPFSDLDLCFKSPLNDRLIAQIEGAFEESDLPFKVDLVSFDHMSQAFRQLVEKDFVQLSP